FFLQPAILRDARAMARRRADRKKQRRSLRSRSTKRLPAFRSACWCSAISPMNMANRKASRAVSIRPGAASRTRCCRCQEITNTGKSYRMERIPSRAPNAAKKATKHAKPYFEYFQDNALVQKNGDQKGYYSLNFPDETNGPAAHRAQSLCRARRPEDWFAG